MNRLIARIASADNALTRAVDGLARKVLPGMTASGFCYMRCTGTRCVHESGLLGRRKCEYCTEGYWNGKCFCSAVCY
jgi:hypothetical protein